MISVTNITAGIKQKCSPFVLMMILAFITGLITGAAAFLLKHTVKWISLPLTSGMNASGANWILLLAPVIGIMLTGIYQRYILHKTIYHGTDRLQQSISARKYSLPGDLTYAPIVASTLTLGFGGSAGSEGPIAYTGAAIGSNIGRLFNARPPLMKVLLACGAAAGIAGIFKAPIGGALFSLEVLAVTLSVGAVLAVVLASVTAGLTAYALSGCIPDLIFHNATPFDWHWAPWILLLGIFCGLYSFYYAQIMILMRRWYNSMHNPWIKNLISGSVLACLVFLFPPLFGEGYGFIGELLAGKTDALSSYSLFASDAAFTLTPILIAFGIIMVKAFACASTNSGGGVAGDFAPTLMAGCVAGFLFATSVNSLTSLSLPVADFAFFGMAAVMAGAIRAPFMAIFIAVEMAQTYELLLPVTLTATVSYLLVLGLRRLRHMPVTLPDNIN